MKIVCFGDSLTFGYGVSKKERWTELLKYKGDFEIINKGVNGDTTTGMLSRSFQDVIKNSPFAAIIMGGTNDLLMGRSTGNIVENINILCNEMKSNDVIPIIGIQPLIAGSIAEIAWEPGANYEDVNKNITGYREWIKKSSNGIIYADFYEIIRDACENGCEKDYYIDGLHLSAKGHELLAGGALEAIRQIRRLEE